MNKQSQSVSLPKPWHQIDKDDEDHIYVYKTDKTDDDPHYYDRSLEIVKEQGGYGVYARKGKERDAKEVFHQIFEVKSDAQRKIKELMEKGF